MADLFAQPAATPLTPEETRGLIPAYIAWRAELNEAEQENIARAQNWALDRRRNLLSERFILDLHRHMLGDACATRASCARDTSMRCGRRTNTIWARCWRLRGRRTAG